jgi:hypothetical protein
MVRVGRLIRMIINKIKDAARAYFEVGIAKKCLLHVLLIKPSVNLRPRALVMERGSENIFSMTL